jgi:hypothetical protein
MSLADNWSGRLYKEWLTDTHIQDTNENAADTAHFEYVHSTDAPKGIVTYDGIIRHTHLEMVSHGFAETMNLPADTSNVVIFTSTSYGPGINFQEFIGLGRHSFMIGMITPIEKNRTKIRFLFLYPGNVDKAVLDLTEAHNLYICSQIEEDIAIWDRKVHIPNPILCDGDGPIAAYRKWFSQFYAD